MDEAGKGRNKTYNSFIGNYISGTEVPASRAFDNLDFDD